MIDRHAAVNASSAGWPVSTGGLPGPHKIQGIGAGFIPENLKVSLIDEVLAIGNETAFAMARDAARLEGLPVGISSGAALAAAFELGARKDMAGKRIVAILPSGAERYLSTALFENFRWDRLHEHPACFEARLRSHLSMKDILTCKTELHPEVLRAAQPRRMGRRFQACGGYF